MNKLIIEAFQTFLTTHELASGTLDDGCGNKLKLKKRLDGFFKVVATSETLTVKDDEDGGK